MFDTDMKHPTLALVAVLLVLMATVSCDDGHVASVTSDRQKVSHEEHYDEHEGHDHDSHDGGGGVSEDMHEERAGDTHEDNPGPGRDGDIHDERQEGVVELGGPQRERMGIKLRAAGPGTASKELVLMGELGLNLDDLVHVTPKVEGVAAVVYVSLNDRVKVGQLIALIDSAELAKAKADYLELLLNMDIMAKSYERKKLLHNEMIVSQADLLEAEALYQKARSGIIAARRGLLMLGLSQDEVEALPEADESGFGAYELRAPISGTIIEKHITRGEKLATEDNVFTLADLSTVWADLQIPQRDINMVEKGMEVIIESGGEKAFGRIKFVQPLMDKQSRTALARATLDNSDGRWNPGAFATARVLVYSDDTSVSIEKDAVQGMDGGDVVFVPAGDGFKAVPVTRGRAGRDSVEIISGLRPGDMYVAEGAFELKAIMVTSSLGGHAGHGH
jgi:cobalt-zinc-cadmium efflux system membrane fusion protein